MFIQTETTQTVSFSSHLLNRHNLKPQTGSQTVALDPNRVTGLLLKEMTCDTINCTSVGSVVQFSKLLIRSDLYLMLRALESILEFIISIQTQIPLQCESFVILCNNELQCYTQ